MSQPHEDQMREIDRQLDQYEAARLRLIPWYTRWLHLTIGDLFRSAVCRISRLRRRSFIRTITFGLRP